MNKTIVINISLSKFEEEVCARYASALTQKLKDSGITAVKVAVTRNEDKWVASLSGPADLLKEASRIVSG